MCEYQTNKSRYEVECENLRKGCEELKTQLVKQQEKCAILEDELHRAKTQILQIKEEGICYQGQVKAYEFCIEKLCGM